MPIRKTILLVEDTPELLETLRQLLEAAGYQVFCAKSGAEALELLGTANAAIDVIVTDLVMPHMNGIELADRVKRNRPQTKILMISGENAGETSRAAEKGVDMLTHPFWAGFYWNMCGTYRKRRKTQGQAFSNAIDRMKRNPLGYTLHPSRSRDRMVWSPIAAYSNAGTFRAL